VRVAPRQRRHDTRSSLRCGLLAAVGLIAWLAPRPAAAEVAPPRLPSKAELSAAEALLGRGIVAVVEPSSGSNRASMLLLAQADAPASGFFETLRDPDRYPDVMPAMEQVRVTGRRGNAISYSWVWRAASAPWRGSCAMALAPPYDAAVRITRSDLGTGSLRWHFYDRGPRRSIGAEAVTFDLSRGHPLLRWLMGRGTAMPEAVALIISSVLLEGSRRGALGQTRPRDGPPLPSPPMRAPRGLRSAELTRIVPLLRRGAVVLLETTTAGALREVVVAESVDAPRDRLLAVIQDFESWDDAVPVVERIETISRDGESAVARISMNLSALTIRGTARVTSIEDGVEVVGTDGGLRRMHLRIQVANVPGGGTVLISSGRAELAQASFLLRRMIRREPYFAHGLNSSAQLLLVRGLAAAASR